LGRLMALSEPEHRFGRGMAIRSSAVAVAAGGDIDIEAGEHEVAASIQATFALELD
jgi:hypothetical protein